MKIITITRKLFIGAIFVLLSILGSSNLMGQTATITGKIISEQDGLGIPGASISIKGTTKGTYSNDNGTFSLEISGTNTTLVISSMGFDTQELIIGNQTVIEIILVPSSSVLGEVVFTALGIKREEKSLGYSVARVDGKEVNRLPQENVLNSWRVKWLV